MSEGCSEKQGSAKNSAPKLPSLIVKPGHFLFLPRLLFSSLLFKLLADAVSERWFFQLKLTRESKEHLWLFTTTVQGSFLRLMLH